MKKKSHPYMLAMETCLAFLKKLSEEEISKIETGELLIQFDLVNKKEIPKKNKDVATISADEVISF